MFCKNCGKEIKEGNTFCTNCGTKYDETIPNRKEPIKIKFTYLLISIVILIVSIIVICFILNKPNKEIKANENTNNLQINITPTEIKQYQVEIGKEYNYELNDEIGSIKFNTGTDFTLETGLDCVPSVIETGTYIIEKNIIKLTITYSSNNDYGDTNYVALPYTKEMTILDNGDIEYKTENRTYLYKKKSQNTTINKNEQTNLLDTIYEKYPDLKSKDGYICTDGEQYWILDNEGKKLYFTDLESFESALVKSTTSEETTNQEPTGMKIDMNKFVKELSYKSMSTVHDGVHGGDGYRYDYLFYNDDLSLNDFKIENSNSETVYTLETKGNDESKYKFILTIKVEKDYTLKEINITCAPPTPQAKGILNCAMEVEEALGYTLFNRRNNKIVSQLEEKLKLNNYIEKATKNYAITESEIFLQLTNEQYNEEITFEYKYIDNKLSYTATFK